MKARCDRDLGDDAGARGSLASAMLVPTPGSI
jgi:hypothetical protein